MSFENQIRRFADRATKRMNTTVRGACSDLTLNVISATPKDSGVLVANWKASVGRPLIGVTRNVVSPQQGVQRAISQSQPAIFKAPGKIFYLVNNSPYASIVEFGMYPNPPKQGTYLKRGQVKRGRVGPGYFKFSRGGFSDVAQRGMARISVEKVRTKFR